MVSPVLHVLPLTIRSAYFPMIALLLRAFRDLWSSPRCWKPIVHQVFSQGMVGKNFFACGALNSSSPIACGGPGRAIFPAAFRRGSLGSDKQSAERASSSSSSDGSGGGRTAAPASLSAAVSRPQAADAARRERSGVAIGFPVRLSQVLARLRRAWQARLGLPSRSLTAGDDLRPRPRRAAASGGPMSNVRV